MELYCRIAPFTLSLSHTFNQDFSWMFVLSIYPHTIKRLHMQKHNKPLVAIESTINAPVEKVWLYWNGPEHITQWCYASDDWHAPWAKNDLKVGGSISSRMEAKDGSMGFDFGGVYDIVNENEQIQYTMADGRRVEVLFHSHGNATNIAESFDAEDTNPIEMQQMGWQAILDNFKKYVESL